MVFRDNMLDLMAYYIKLTEGALDTTEFETQLIKYQHISREEVKASLEFACGLKFYLTGIRRKRELKDYLESE